MKAVASLNRLAELNVIAHPLRLKALQVLRKPGSAAALARALGETRQKMHFHVKQLEQAGLVRKVGERRNGGFVEDLYQAVASSFVVSPVVMWGDEHRAGAVRDQLPLQSLVGVGETLQRDAASLIDRATFQGDRIASACVDASLHFANEADRAAFMKDYFAAVKPLIERYGAAKGDAYRLVLAIYPDPRVREQGT